MSHAPRRADLACGRGRAALAVLLAAWPGWLPAGTSSTAAPLPRQTLAALKIPGPASSGPGRDLRFEAVVVGMHRGAGRLYVQDESAGISLVDHPALPRFQPGERLEVEGQLHLRQGIHVVVPSRVRQTGLASLPDPVPATAQSLLQPRVEGSRVALEGLVVVTTPDVRYSNAPVVLLLRLADGEVMASVWDRQQDAWLLGLRGSRLRITGVSTPVLSPSGQIVQGGVLITPLDEVEVVVPGPERLAQGVSTPIASLLTPGSNPEGPALQRIDGVVTAVLATKALVVEDASAGVVVRTAAPHRLRPGHRVSLLGYAATEFVAGSAAAQQHAQLIFTALEHQASGSGPLPAPVPVTGDTLPHVRHDLRRVSLEAQVLGTRRRNQPGEFEVSIQLDSIGLVVRGRDLPAGAALPAAGSRVQVQGVLDPRPLADSDDAAPRIHLARPGDLVTLAGPPLKFTGPLLWALALVTGVAGLALAWAQALRLTVRRRTADLTQANAELARATAAKSLFLANMSHEVRTPMHAVLGWVQVLQRHPLTGDQHEILDRIATAGRSLLRLLNDILDLSRVEAGRLTLDVRPFRLAPVLARLEDLFRETARARGLAWEVAPLPPALSGNLLGDPERLEQILANLASNALKFTERGGVVVETGWVAEDSRGLRVRLAVRDTGPGLDPGTLARLFQPFTQAESSTHRRHGGAGLGLSICRCLAELMGGTLGADSQPGQGSTFWVELPFPRPAEAAAGPDETGRLESAAGPAAAGPRLPGCAVLVVDDQRVNLELAGGLLRQEGAIPTLMEDPQEALACLRREPHRFHAVLMDGQMPGLSGAETTRALRQEPGLQTLPIIAFTAAVLPAQVEEARAAGANDFVPKPVDAEQLVAVLRRWIRPRQDPAGTARAPRSRPVDTTPFPAVPGIDTAHAALRLRHDVQLFQTLREEFRREFSAVVTELREDLAQGRRENARRRLHTLVGTAGSLGALDLARAARDLQEALKDGAPADLGPALAALAGQHERLFAHLTAAPDAPGGDPPPGPGDLAPEGPHGG